MKVFFVEITQDNPFRIVEGKVIKTFPEYKGSYECEAAHNCRTIQLVECINPDGISKSIKRIYEEFTFNSISDLKNYYKKLVNQRYEKVKNSY
jgi:hypothetical protein